MVFCVASMVVHLALQENVNIINAYICMQVMARPYLDGGFGGQDE
jgi:hypothetical protein